MKTNWHIVSLLLILGLYLGFLACTHNGQIDRQDNEKDSNIDDDHSSGDDDDSTGDDEGDDDNSGGSGYCAWQNPSTGLWWEQRYSLVTCGAPCHLLMDWDEAVNYCNNLRIGPGMDWYIPTISELRSLVRGCQVTGTGGSCGVTDLCTSQNNCYGELPNECQEGCPREEGPADGVYIPDDYAFEFIDYTPIWSQTPVTDSRSAGDEVWTISFKNAGINIARKSSDKLVVVCVRAPTHLEKIFAGMNAADDD